MPAQEIVIPFGADGRLVADIAADRILVRHIAPPACTRLPDRLRECLNTPLGFPALAQAVLPDDHIVIALDDHTPCAATLIRGCWDVLAKRGIEPERTTIVQPDSSDASPDPLAELPADISHRIRHLRHSSADPGNRAYLASTTSGERIYLSRDVIEADFVMCVGTIAYDPLLGYRGTNSVFYPGMSSAEVIRKCRGQGHDELGPDDVRSLRQTIDEVGWLLGVQFAVQVVPSGRDGVAAIYAGATEAVMQAGKSILATAWTVNVEERPELVVVAVDNVQPEGGWTAIGAALDVARRLVARNGQIVVLSQLDAPLSLGMELLRDSRTPREVFEPLRRVIPEDFVAATQITQAIDWANVYLRSRLDGELVEDLFMTPIRDDAETLRLIESQKSIAIIESAEFAFGQVQSSGD